MADANIQGTETVDEAEVTRFNLLAKTWWDPAGPMRPLHAMNPTRLSFILQHCAQHFGRNAQAPDSLAGLRAIDVGCGGGLLTEPLCRLGADVTGLDAAPDSIAIARHHAEEAGLTAGQRLRYCHSTAEDIAATGATFDIVVALEIVEHVRDLKAFLKAVSALLKPGGALFLSTINRTPAAWLSAIVGAERVLKLLPRGTHDYEKLVKPAELVRGLRRFDIKVHQTNGLQFDILERNWTLSQQFNVNYILYARRHVRQ